ncbi:MAG: HIT family protein [Bacteroidia bacterium]|nr:HIT family protein [Bacteroidia bacterium]
MASVFSKIIEGSLPGYIIAQNNDAIAFLDIQPLAIGHVLIVPKKEVDYIFDLDDETYQSIHALAKKVAHAQRKVIPCIRIGVAVIGLEVPHAHIHLIPLNKISDINFSLPKLNVSAEQLKSTCELIKAAYQNLYGNS